jgi:hypothetical protein
MLKIIDLNPYCMQWRDSMPATKMQRQDLCSKQDLTSCCTYVQQECLEVNENSPGVESGPQVGSFDLKKHDFKIAYHCPFKETAKPYVKTLNHFDF